MLETDNEHYAAEMAFLKTNKEDEQRRFKVAVGAGGDA